MTDFDIFDDALAAAPLQAQAALTDQMSDDPWVLSTGFGGDPSYSDPKPAFYLTHDPVAPTSAQDVVNALMEGAQDRVLNNREDYGMPPPVPDAPEPAVPVAYGDDTDPARVAARLAAALPPQAPPAPREDPQEKARRLLAYVDASLRGETPPGPNPFAHIQAGQADNEVAAAAANYLVTKSGGLQSEALKSYSPIERQAIIDEGEDVTAGNLDRLDIKGTHYENLASTSAKSEDEDLWMLDGDPNGPD